MFCFILLCVICILMFTQPFHIIPPSRWPFFASFTLFITVIGLVFSWSGAGYRWFFVGSYPFLISVFLWFRDISIERHVGGFHSLPVQSGLRVGIVLFIASEVIFFFGFFWAYLHFSLRPNIELGSSWPPVGVSPLPFQTLPLLNTVILLSSGATLTWAHFMVTAFDLPPLKIEDPVIKHLSWAPLLPTKILRPNHFIASLVLMLTISLGFVFLILQLLEYSLAPFTIADSSYGSCFFIATGFHGLHVLIGCLFLSVALYRLCSFHFTSQRHLGLDFAIWYWHFVDVVWLLLFLIIYIWGS